MYYYPLSSLRAATISWGVFRMTLSVSEGTGFRPNRPLADAQGYSPLRNATNGYRLRLAAMRGTLPAPRPQIKKRQASEPRRLALVRYHGCLRLLRLGVLHAQVILYGSKAQAGGR